MPATPRAAPKATITLHGAVALVSLEAPPVNALGQAVRQLLANAFEEIRAHPGIRAVVLTGTDRAFSAGADITEFGGTTEGITLPELVDRIEDFPLPVTAAIAGVALGGGLELALAAHTRIAHPEATLGLPEITLGIIPGAGGTGRLPRVVGADRAVDMILSGRRIDAGTAAEAGLVDAVLDGGDFPSAAVAWATSRLPAAAGEPATPMRTRDRTERLAAGDTTAGTVERLAATALRKAKDPFAARAAVEAIAAGLEQGFEAGAATERRLFLERVASPESAAQRHLFAAERASRKPRALDTAQGPAAGRHVGQAGVIGAGTMGGGIALALATVGVPVTVVDTGQEALDRGLAQVRRNLDVSVSHGSRTPAQADEQFARITGTIDYADLADADLVIEAAFEDLEVKQGIFAALDANTRPDAVLATNTSYLDVDAIAATVADPSRVLGMHFFSPANVMELVEVVRGARTAPDVLATAVALARRLGKCPVVVGVCHGFVGNRMLEVRGRQAEALLLEGALPGQVDDVLTAFGFRMGPFAMADMAGLDIGWRNRQAQGTSAPVSDALCEAGRYGQKTGAGFFAYGGRERTNDPATTRIIELASAEQGIERRDIGDEEILERLLYPMVNEGARILAEGIAERPGDIDLIWIKGYNWPAYRGGPMWYADQVGRDRIAARLEHHARATGDQTLRPVAWLTGDGTGADAVGGSGAGTP
ncbi:3-hydroxyacyl-CoA dehydrogenase NAD-binding domain-containing protein [Arthrobacter sp. JSM 101049]|uniref:3-hydroxyacyl-CoA dehydrogenase NAD-binding domain-containing protein n=1 Tax=Arthrobacter sp. JSM 101049 TaxID=929097 RepID=UPI003568C414